MLEKSCAFSKRYMYVKHSGYKKSTKMGALGQGRERTGSK